MVKVELGDVTVTTSEKGLVFSRDTVEIKLDIEQSTRLAIMLESSLKLARSQQQDLERALSALNGRKQ